MVEGEADLVEGKLGASDQRRAWHAVDGYFLVESKRGREFALPLVQRGSQLLTFVQRECRSDVRAELAVVVARCRVDELHQSAPRAGRVERVLLGIRSK